MIQEGFMERVESYTKMMHLYAFRKDQQNKAFQILPSSFTFVTICATSEESQQSEEGTEIKNKNKNVCNFFRNSKVYLKTYK